MNKTTSPLSSDTEKVDLLTANIQRRSDPNSDAKRFDRAMASQKGKETKERSTMEEMLGADPVPFTRIRDTDDTPVVFYPKPPKLVCLPKLMYDLSISTSDINSRVELIMEMSTSFLYIDDAELGYQRRATLLEIQQCMEFADTEPLKEMCERYLNVTLDKLNGKSEGNA